MNCLVVDDDKISRRILERYIQRTEFLELVASCSSAIEAVNIIRNTNIDLIFLDVEMPEMSGLEFIKTLDDRPQIILVTAHEKYAVEAFENNVNDFIVKPISYTRFVKSASKLKREFDSQQNTQSNTGFTFVKTESRIIKINMRDVQRIEALADYVMIVSSKDKYIIHSTMKGIENKLPPNDFIRVHRSHIVRLDKIESIDENTLVINKKLIPIGGSYRKKLMQQINLI